MRNASFPTESFAAGPRVSRPTPSPPGSVLRYAIDQRRATSRTILIALACGWLIGASVGGRSWGDERPEPLRLATFNIRYHNPQDGPDAWPLRKAGVAQLLRDHGADVVGMQEVLHRQLQDLHELLPDFDAFGVGRDDGREKGEYSPILYRRDRLRLIAGSTRWLSEHPDQPGSKSWDAAITRIATRCLFEDRRTKQWLVVYNTHFDHRGEEARRQSARLLRQWTAQEAAPTFVLGDFNCTRRDAPFQELTAPRDGGRLRELRGVAGVRESGPDSTWNGFKQIEPGQQIDFIFASPTIRAIRYQVDDRRLENGRFPSDHLPVIVETTLPARVVGVGTESAVRAFNVDHTFPLLIRKEWNVLRHVAIEVAQSGPARLKSLEFKLTGDALADDLEQLQMVVTGDRPTMATGPAWGAPQPPAAELKFEGDLELKPGRHHAWLLCRLKTTASLDHGVAAMCARATLASGERVAAQDSGLPLARQRFGVALRQAGDDGVHTYRIPALTTAKDGTLLCVYDMRRRASRDLQEDIDIGLSRSPDGGRTWEAPRVIMDMGEHNGLPQSQNGCSDPGIVVDRQTGEIFCFAVWMWGKPGKHQWQGDGSEPGFEIGKTAQLLMVRSTDGGLTWSQPENLTRSLKQERWWLLAPAPQSGFQWGEDGTLVMPMQGRDEQGVPFATIMTSRDHGRTWRLGQPAYSQGNECQAARLSDDSIMLNIRNNREKFRAVYVTRDFGQTWTEHPTNRNTLVEPTCNGSLLAVTRPDAQSGKSRRYLLFANPRTQAGRTHHTIQVSEDDGLSWRKGRLNDEGRGAGYPSLTELSDGRIGVVYEGSPAHLVFQRFQFEELLAELPPTP